MPVLMFDLGLDHRYFFSLGRYVNEFIQILSFFFRKSSFKLRCETVLWSSNMLLSSLFVLNY